MPEVLQQFKPFNRQAGARKSLYAWELYLDGKPRLFTQGEDFSCKTSSFVSLASRAALAMGCGIRTSISEDGVQVVLQAIENDERQPRRGRRPRGAAE